MYDIIGSTPFIDADYLPLTMFPHSTTNKKFGSRNNFSKLSQPPETLCFLHFSAILFLHP